MEQAAARDVDQFIDTIVPNREINQLGGLCGVRIDKAELTVRLRNYIVRQSHRRGWYAQGKGILGTR